MRDAITGGTGVLGRRLLPLLEPNAALFAGDVRDADAVSAWVRRVRPTRLFHLAARVPVARVEADPDEAMAVNATGSRNVARALAAHAPDAWLFHASTSHCYRPQDRALREDDPLDPHTLYGRTKRAAEDAVREAVRETGLRVCVGRLFSFWDERQAPPFLYPSLKARIARRLGDAAGDPSVPFALRGASDIRDLSPAPMLAALIAALAAREARGVVNLGAGRGVRIEDVAQRIAGGRLRIEASGGAPTAIVADLARLRAALGDETDAILAGWSLPPPLKTS